MARRVRFTNSQRAGEALAVARPLPRPQPARRARPSEHDLARVDALATELGEALDRFLGPGCAASPALTWDETGYDTRLIAFEVPAATADRLVDALRVAAAGARLVNVLDTHVLHAERGPPHTSVIRAYGALRAAVRTRAARQLDGP